MLLEVLRQPGHMRQSAAHSLGEIRDMRAFGSLLALMKDGEATEDERAAAALGIGLLGSRDATPALFAAAEDKSAPTMVRVEAIRAVAKLDGITSAPLLTRIAKSEGTVDEVRFSAAMELVAMTNGAIEDVAILPALKWYVDKEHESYEGHEAVMKRRISALKKVVANGATAAIRSRAAEMLRPTGIRTQVSPTGMPLVVCSILIGGLIAVALGWAALRKSKRKKIP